MQKIENDELIKLISIGNEELLMKKNNDINHASVHFFSFFQHAEPINLVSIGCEGLAIMIE